ncbi:MAG: 16S rRNA (adenine(1518)-N(6)/adenine(1519)-N(6))-dimethyltransferase RsmA [Patescibacteria group bacterium]
MLNIQEIKKLLKQNNIAILKKFGQNFLVSQSVLNKIIETANINPQDTILEIGPGLGVLTFELAKKASKVIAIEKDRKMAEILQKNLVKNNISNVEVINEDALVPPHSSAWGRGVGRNPYKVVANLPYNIATAVIMKFLESENPPQQIVIMVQKEVAQRIIATPPHMNKLAIFCQLYSTPKIIDYVPPTAFYPKPKVDSAILQLTPNGVRHMSDTCLTPLINTGFSHPRKTLLNNLYEGRPNTASKEKIGQWLLQNNINPNQRAETLSLEQWQILAKQYPQAS